MSVFVLEIAGRGVLAFSVETEDEAQAFVEAEWLQGDLMSLDSEGVPVWDGKAELFVRDPYPEEVARFDVAASKEGDRELVCYLVPVTDPTDDA